MNGSVSACLAACASTDLSVLSARGCALTARRTGRSCFQRIEVGMPAWEKRADYRYPLSLSQCEAIVLLRCLGDRNFFRQIDVLNRIQQLDAFIHRTLECFSSGNQAHAAAAFIDDRSAHGFGHVARAF